MAQWLRLLNAKRALSCLLAACCLLIAAHLLTQNSRPRGLRPATCQRLSGNATNFSSVGQHFYNAYYDTRSSLQGQRFVRIVAVLDTKSYAGRFRCRLSDKNGCSSFTATARKSRIGNGMPHGAHYYQEFLLSCQIADDLSAASFVVVQSANGKYRSAAIKVSHNPESSSTTTPQKLIANCVSVTFGEPNEHRLIEWLEAQRLLGMDKVVLHFHHVTNRRFEEVAAAYEKEGFVDIRRIACPFCVKNKENWMGLLLMSTAINQCLYENLGRYKYTAVFDLDELIVPQQHANYLSMLKSLAANGNRSSFVFRNWYHFSELGELPEVPQHLHMLRHPYKTKNCSSPGYSVKSIHSSQHVVALQNHYSWDNAPGSPRRLDAGTDIGINQHFKKCHFDRAECAELTNRTQRAVGDRLNKLLAAELTEAVQLKLQQLSLTAKKV